MACLQQTNSDIGTRPEQPPLKEYELRQPVTDLEAHVEKLSRKLGTNTDEDGFDMEFNYIEQKSEHDAFFGDYKSAIKTENRSKNRYSNVLPLEGTRVKLEGSEDYINANYIAGLVPGSEKRYIATQGPLESTVSDFWRMCWEQNSKVIVMLTREYENERHKCQRYWPASRDEALEAPPFRIVMLSIEEDTGMVSRRLLLEHTMLKESREIIHLQYTEWPDHGLPVSTAAFRDILHRVDTVPQTGPVIVHCSAGIGRTGTFCAVHSIIEYLRQELAKGGPSENGADHSENNLPAVNLLDTVLQLRKQRIGMVQTKEQYMFCYRALQEEWRNLLILRKRDGASAEAPECPQQTASAKTDTDVAPMTN